MELKSCGRVNNVGGVVLAIFLVLLCLPMLGVEVAIPLWVTGFTGLVAAALILLGR